MKLNKINILIFGFIFAFVFNVSRVNAQKCVYTTSFFGKEQSFVLETENDSSTELTKLSGPSKFVYDDDTETLKISNGKCPKISIYQKRTDASFKLFASQQSCFDDSDGIFDKTDNDLCSNNLSGKIDTSGQSSGSLVEGPSTEKQFKYDKDSSTDSSCHYTLNDRSLMADYDLTVKDSGDGSCGVGSSGDVQSCRLTITDFNGTFKANEGKFTCPPYIYVTIGKEEHNNYSVAIFQINSAGNENDKDKGEATGAQMGFFNPETLCGENNENCNLDITKFCVNPYAARTFKFIGLILMLGKVLAVALIIGLGIVDLVKIIISGQMSDVKKQGKNIIMRVVIGVIIFLLPTIIIGIYNGTQSIIGDEVMQTTTDDDGNTLNVPTDFANCVYCVLDPTSKNCVVQK